MSLKVNSTYLPLCFNSNQYCDDRLFPYGTQFSQTYSYLTQEKKLHELELNAVACLISRKKNSNQISKINFIRQNKIIVSIAYEMVKKKSTFDEWGIKH